MASHAGFPEDTLQGMAPTKSNHANRNLKFGILFIILIEFCQVQVSQPREESNTKRRVKKRPSFSINTTSTDVAKVLYWVLVIIMAIFASSLTIKIEGTSNTTDHH